MTLEEAVNILSEFLMIENWEKDENEAYSIIVDDQLEIRVISIDRDYVIFNGSIGEQLPSTGNSAEARLKQLLQWNFARIQDNNDVLSVDQQTRKISVTRKLALSKLELDSLLDNLESFVKNIDFWAAAAERKSVTIGLSPLLNHFHLR